jgi:alginate O-acetyltransferase complex protein AlgI
MSFVSPEFALLALVFFPLYWALAAWPRWQQRFLTLSGCALYATWAPMFALVLLAYSLCIWGLGRWIAAPPQDANPSAQQQRLALSVGLVLCVLFLGLVKYYEFVRDSLAALLPLGSGLPTLDLVAPVGVSFFTFQAITYLVSLKGEATYSRTPGEVLLFLGFWPTLFAGPILRATDFFAQLDAGRTGRPRQPWRALYLILLGVTQKMVLASWLAQTFVDAVFGYPQQHSAPEVLAAMLGYTLQILLDFGGYTLIVTGLGLLLGFELPANFRQPYLARNLPAFWQRWHISLSSFIRDYIYIPLGGSRLGWGRTQCNVVLAMLISGAWHGANWTFLLWGLLHGLGVLAFNLGQRLGLRPLPAWLAHSLTFGFVMLAWLFFRAQSWEQALGLLAQLSQLGQFSTWRVAPDLPWLRLLALTVLVLSLSRHALSLERWAVQSLQALRPARAAALLGLWLWAVIALGPEGVPSFIYYRF